MPTNTFLHLPAEKRRRRTDAAGRDLTRLSRSEASLNRRGLEGIHPGLLFRGLHQPHCKRRRNSPRELLSIF